jgi:hypothetical protein
MFIKLVMWILALFMCKSIEKQDMNLENSIKFHFQKDIRKNLKVQIIGIQIFAHK